MAESRKKLKTLIVDDNEKLNIRLMEKGVNSTFVDVEIDKALSAEDALAKTIENEYDLIFCDLNMPVKPLANSVKEKFIALGSVVKEGNDVSSSGALFLRNLRNFEGLAKRQPVDFIFCTSESIESFNGALAKHGILETDYQGKNPTKGGKSFNQEVFFQFKTSNKKLFEDYAKSKNEPSHSNSSTLTLSQSLSLSTLNESPNNESPKVSVLTQLFTQKLTPKQDLKHTNESPNNESPRVSALTQLFTQKQNLKHTDNKVPTTPTVQAIKPTTIG